VAGRDVVRFRAVVRDQAFGGATELLQIQCTGGPILLARIPAAGSLSGEMEFEFSPVDAVLVRDEEG